jgi:hypothetical protein
LGWGNMTLGQSCMLLLMTTIPAVIAIYNTSCTNYLRCYNHSCHCSIYVHCLSSLSCSSNHLHCIISSSQQTYRLKTSIISAYPVISSFHIRHSTGRISVILVTVFSHPSS